VLTADNPLERAVHEIIFPMRSTSDEIPHYNHNLWIIDENLTYHSYQASDMPLKRIERLESESARRPDLFIFDLRMLFAEGEQPLSSLTTVEFKRPMRDDYTADDNPLRQSFEIMKEIRSGKLKDERGRPIGLAAREIPATCYVICDITPSLKESMMDMEGAQSTPDN
jgi:hypothetical protein